MKEIRIKAEKLAKRCEICHQKDYFDAQSNQCLRCSDMVNKVNSLEEKFDSKTPKRGIITYIGITLMYLFLVFWYLGESQPSFYQLFSLFIPIIVIITQIIYPTIVGWWLIFIPSVIYTIFVFCFFCFNTFGSYKQWQTDFTAYSLGFAFLLFLISICVGLFYHKPVTLIRKA